MTARAGRSAQPLLPDGVNGNTVRLALLATWLTAGGNFLGFKVAVGAFPPFLLMSLRLGLAGLILSIILLAIARPWPRPSLREWRDAFFSGLLFLVLGQGLIVVGVQHTTAGHAALLAATAPLMTALVAWLLRGRRPDGVRFLGIVLGFAGLLLMILPKAQTSSEITGSLIILTGALAWGGGMLQAETACRPKGILLAAALQMLPASVVLLSLSMLSGELDGFAFAAVTLDAWAALAFLVLAGTLLGYSAFVWMLPRVAAATANSFFYVGPVITLFLGWLLLSEEVGLLDLAAAAVTLAGVALMVSSPPSTTQK